MYNAIVEKLRDKKICILGFGMEGRSTYNFIRRHLPNQHITIIDKKDIRDSINDSNVDFIIGDNYLDNLSIYDLIIKTPGITFKDIDITNIKDKITSQLELLLEVFKNNIIGITGTKGKSTTSSLIYKIISDQGYDTYLLGNIGKAMLDDVENFKEDTKLVIEMSCHQLEFVKVSPHIGIVLNLFEDHLDHAGTLHHYHENKMNMFKYQTSDDYAIYSVDSPYLYEWMELNKYQSKIYKVTVNNNKDDKTIYLDKNNVVYNNKLLYTDDSTRKILGKHNLSNIMFALMVAGILKLDMNKVRNSINTFNPLEHRLELVGTYNDIIFYNDSISTIPMATINAIEALKEVDTLIFGGMDRGIDYKPLEEYLFKSNVNNLICMPSTGYTIGHELQLLNTNKNIYYISSLEEAVKKAKEVTRKGKICLMSPAASSYEYFKNFEEKGRKYKEYVREEN